MRFDPYKALVQNIYNAVQRGATKIRSGTSQIIQNVCANNSSSSEDLKQKSELTKLHTVRPEDFSLGKEVLKLVDEQEDYKPSPEAKAYFQELITKIKDQLRTPATQLILLGALIGGNLGGLAEEGTFDAFLDSEALKSIPQEVKQDLSDFVTNSNDEIRSLIMSGESPVKISREIIHSLPKRTKEYIFNNELVFKGLVLGIIAALSYLENLQELGSQDGFALGSYLGGFNLFRFKESFDLRQMEADGSFNKLKDKLSAYEAPLSISNNNHLDFMSSAYRTELKSAFHHLDNVFRSSWEGSEEGQARSSLYLAMRLLNENFRRWDYIFSDLKQADQTFRREHLENEYGFNAEQDSALFRDTLSPIVDISDQQDRLEANLQAIGLKYRNFEKNLSRVSNKSELFYVLNEGIEAQHFGREDVRDILNTINSGFGQIMFSSDSSHTERLNSVFIALLVRCPKDRLQEMLETFDDPSVAVRLVRDLDHFKANVDLDLILNSTDENFMQLLEYLEHPDKVAKPGDDMSKSSGYIS